MPQQHFLTIEVVKGGGWAARGWHIRRVVVEVLNAAGDIISIFNNTSGNITITCSITTAYIAGTNTDKATMTLATRGVATVLFISGTVCVVTGNVS